MDSGLVRSYADQLETLAQQITSVASTANVVVGRFAGDWHGHDLESLAHAWQYQHRAQVMALAGHIHELATTARSNAAEQDRASMASVQSAGAYASERQARVDRYAASIESGLMVVGVLGGAFSKVNGVIGAPDLVRKWDEVLTRSGFGARGVAVEKRLASAWTRSSGAVVRGIPHKAAGAASDFGKRFAKVGKGLGIVGLGVTLAEKGGAFINDASHQKWGASVHDALGGTAAILKTTRSPVTYLSGVVIDEYSDVVDMARATDWSHSIWPAPTPANLVHVYGSGAVDGLKQMPALLWKWAT